jgi:hypothetical protein
MEHGWDIKRLVKQMVMSATYRQSAVTTKEKLSIDPENVYHQEGRVSACPLNLYGILFVEQRYACKNYRRPKCKALPAKRALEQATSAVARW